MPTDLIDSRRGDEERGFRPIVDPGMVPLIRPGPGQRLVPQSEVHVLARPGVRRVAVILSCVLVAFLGWRLLRATDVDLVLADGADMVVMQSAETAGRAVLVRVGLSGLGASFRASLAGVPLADVRRAGDDLVRVPLPAGLPEGGYELELTADRALFLAVPAVLFAVLLAVPRVFFPVYKAVVTASGYLGSLGRHLLESFGCRCIGSLSLLFRVR